MEALKFREKCVPVLPDAPATMPVRGVGTRHGRINELHRGTASPDRVPRVARYLRVERGRLGFATARRREDRGTPRRRSLSRDVRPGSANAATLRDAVRMRPRPSRGTTHHAPSTKHRAMSQSALG
ncbi:unnamed protein product, partial [Iphiclides podalirius]